LTGQGHILHTQRWTKTAPITYCNDDGEVLLLKSWMRENLIQECKNCQGEHRGLYIMGV
jgi:hypothetical protein